MNLSEICESVFMKNRFFTKVMVDDSFDENETSIPELDLNNEQNIWNS